jgi:quinol monooxygenase YgiN
MIPPKNAIRVVCVAEFRAFEGKTVALVEALHSLIQPTLQEPGCIRYELNQDVEDARRITFIEKWSDREAFDTHCQTAYIKHYFDDVRPQLVENFVVRCYEEILP